MKKPQTILFFLLLASLFPLRAQTDGSSLPYSFTHQLEGEVPVCRVSHESNAALLRKEPFENKSGDFVFGQEIAVNYSTLNAGKWEELSNGDRLWRLALHSDSAYSLNLQFDYFYLPRGGRLHIYTADKKYLLGAFTEADNQNSRKFATSLLPGGEIVLEYYEPRQVRQQAAIHLSTVVHGYKDFYFTNGKYGSSGSCNVDIQCAEGAPYQEVKRAVCLILYGSRILCTGTLINNTSMDRTPYLLTAYHCLSGKDISNFVFIFNHEADQCGSNHYTDGDAVTGATIVDLGYSSDYALLKLSAVPPMYYRVYYAGWDSRDTAASEAVCIHHPSGDVKKISVCRQPVRHSDSQGEKGNTHWMVPFWNRGTTESGSSGSALFNTKKQIIGQLDGGTASCVDTTGFDVFGKMAYSWLPPTGGGYGLKQWLDPLQSGVTVCDGMDSYQILYEKDAALSEILSPGEHNCRMRQPVRVCWYNNGSQSIENPIFQYQIDHGEIRQAVRSGAWTFMRADTFELASLPLEEGMHHLKVWVKVAEDENGLNDTLETDFSFQNGASLHWRIKTDYYPSQNRWLLKDTSGNILAQSPSTLTARTVYSDTFCLAEGCYDFVIEDSAGDGLYGHDGYGQGYYYLYLQDKAIASGVQFGYRDSIRFCVDSTVSVSPHFALCRPKFQVFPNPCGNFVNIRMENGVSVNADVNLFSVEGRIVKRFRQVGELLELGDLKPGIYLMQFVTPDWIQVEKIIVIKP